MPCELRVIERDNATICTARLASIRVVAAWFKAVTWMKHFKRGRYVSTFTARYLNNKKTAEMSAVFYRRSPYYMLASQHAWVTLDIISPSPLM